MAFIMTLWIGNERRMNPVAMTIINPLKEYWPSRGSNQRPYILKSATLPNELWFKFKPLNIPNLQSSGSPTCGTCKTADLLWIVLKTNIGFFF